MDVDKVEAKLVSKLAGMKKQQIVLGAVVALMVVTIVYHVLVGHA